MTYFPPLYSDDVEYLLKHREMIDKELIRYREDWDNLAKGLRGPRK
jgi:hypothetical protein